MELAIASWLGDSASSLHSPDESKADGMLVESGLFEMVKGGRVRVDEHL